MQNPIVIVANSGASRQSMQVKTRAQCPPGKPLPSGRTRLGEDISAERDERPEAFALAKELAGAIAFKRCLADLLEPVRKSFKLDGDEVACFSNSFNDGIYERTFQYELVTEERQLDELVAMSVDSQWPTDAWLRTAFDHPSHILLSVRTQGARRPQGFISYRRNASIDSFEEKQLQFGYEIAIEYIYVSKRMRGKGLGSALIAPLVMDGERDVRYMAKRLNADRFKSMDIKLQITIEAEAHSFGAERLGNQVFAIIADAGREAFEAVPHNRFDTSGIFENEVYI